MKPYRADLKQLSRDLRNRLTEAERLIWQRLRGGQLHGLQFYRQKPLLDYIVDFYCPKAKLIIEIDGAQHFVCDHVQNDSIRDDRLSAIGLKVLRFNNLQVLREIDAVMIEIDAVIRERKV